MFLQTCKYIEVYGISDALKFLLVPGSINVYD